MSYAESAFDWLLMIYVDIRTFMPDYDAYERQRILKEAQSTC